MDTLNIIKKVLTQEVAIYEFPLFSPFIFHFVTERMKKPLLRMLSFLLQICNPVQQVLYVFGNTVIFKIFSSS